MQRRIASLPPLAGMPGLAQGGYGDVGNLELVVPAADGGFWVFWHNADDVEHHAGAARRCWSGGLHVFGSHLVTLARISQVQAGPNFLEAVALDVDGTLHRLYWTPSDGFVTAGVLAVEVASASAVVEHGGALHLLVVSRDGVLSHHSASLDRYPAVRWDSRPVSSRVAAVALSPDLRAAALIDGDAHVLRHDGHGWAPERVERGPWADVALAGDEVLGLSRDGFAGVRARAITAAATTLDGGRIDVVLAVNDGLVHLWGDGTTWSPPRPVVSEVWAEVGAVIHRRA